MIDALCYALLAGAWLVDAVTPQLFVVAILFNGPIALASNTLRPSLTVRLVILAEIGNVVAGYINGVHAGYHWDVLALGDRALLAASFILVGFLTIRTQENARRAGEAGERERAVERERALRYAMEHVRASLNTELVLRSAVTEAAKLTGADTVTVAVRENAFDIPERYEVSSGSSEVRVYREGFDAQRASLIERAREEGRIVVADASEPLGRLLEHPTIVGTLAVEGVDIAVMLSWENSTPDQSERAAVQDFVDNLSVAVQQARLFIRLAEQNDEIAEKNSELQARSDVIRDIVYALAHDLRTPLVAADTTMNQALSGAYGQLPERYASVLRTSVASNLNLRRLVETLLLVARYEAGEDSHTVTEVSVSETIGRVVAEMMPIAQERKVELTMNAIGDGMTLTLDADELRRAITNLVANALEATPAGGHVRVTAEVSENAIRIDVSDDGYGVSEDRRASLFQRFGGKRGGEGTGLGLYIVRRIAEKYHGHATYAPREPRGSVFALEFPR